MNHKIVCFGEILWDVFPTKQVIGGAPLNVALRLHELGVSTSIVSCVGDDTLGADALAYIKKIGLSTSSIQQTEVLVTGQVSVTLNKEGNASYEIALPVAWDAIALSEELLNTVKKASFFVFGSLALRSPFNRNTLDELLKVAQTKVFDVNLRAPYYHVDMIYELMQRATVVKMNDEELTEIAVSLGCEALKMEEQMIWLSKISNTVTICVTRGAHGALLLHDDKVLTHEGFEVAVVDTVGAGDSFLAVLIKGLLIDNQDAEVVLEYACAVGALVVSKAGGNCEIGEDEIEALIAKKE